MLHARPSLPPVEEVAFFFFDLVGTSSGVSGRLRSAVVAWAMAHSFN